MDQDFGVSYAPFWAKITGFDGVQFYSWVEQQPGVGPSMSDLAGGRRGSTTAAPAWEPNCSTLASGSYVLLLRGYLDPVYDWVYLAVGGASTFNLCGGSGSGSPGPECLCDGVPDALCLTLTNDAGCECLDGLTIDLTRTSGNFYQGVVYSPCTGASVFAQFNSCTGVLSFGGESGGNIPFIQMSAVDCDPAHYAKDAQAVGPSEGNVFCGPSDGTVDIDIVAGDCSGSTPPTVDTDTTDLCSDETALTITGTGFTSPASSNTVTLEDSASGSVMCTVVSGTSTSLVLSLDAPPIAALGALTADVTNANGSSGATTVATVIDCTSTITRLSLGTAQSALGAGGVSLDDLTILAGRLYVVVLSSVGTDGSGAVNPGTSVQRGANVFAPSTHGQSLPVGAAIKGSVEVYYWFNTGGTLSGQTIQVDDLGATGDAFQVEVVEVTGGVAILDAFAGSSGLLSVPDAGVSGTTIVPDEYVQGAFLTVGVGPPQAWQNGFSEGQNQTETVSTIVVSELEGYRILSSTGTVQAALDQSVAAWAGLEVSFR